MKCDVRNLIGWQVFASKPAKDCYQFHAFSTFLLHKKRNSRSNTATLSKIEDHISIVSCVQTYTFVLVTKLLDVNCVLTFRFIFLNLLSKVPAGFRLIATMI